MSRLAFTEVQRGPARDSLELASLADSDEQDDLPSEASSLSGISSSRRLSFENEDPLDNANPAGRGRMHPRSYSVSSAFDFTPALFPLQSTSGGYTALGAPSQVSLSLERGGAHDNLEKQKTLTFLNGLSLVVGLVIGSGIFSSPAQVNSHTGSPGAALIVWAISGLLTWTGAALSSQDLRRTRRLPLTWTAILVLKPGSAAIIAIIFGEYVIRAAIGADVEEINPWINKAPAFLALAVVTFLNCISTRFAARIGDLFMFFKFIALIAITVIGIIVAATGLSFNGPANTDWKSRNWFDGTTTDISSWAVAIYAGLWAFDGWDNTNYVTGEFKNPSKDLPRVIHTGMPTVIICYILANIAYIFVLPLATINKSNTVAVQFGNKVFGATGSLILALIVSGSCFGALNATTFTSGRLVYAAGREGYIPAVFGTVGFGHRNSQLPAPAKFRKRSWLTKKLRSIFGDDAGFGATPINGMLLNACLTAAYVAVGEFKSLITFYGVAGYTFYFLTVLGLIVLRIREPHLERPYRTWITTPIIFCCVSLFLVVRAVVNEPVQTLVVVGFVVAGVPAYYWRIRGRDSGGQREGEGRFWRRWGRGLRGR
ncbi:Y+L amino acid transporter 2 [Cyphellophora attinorum]|uniref:Y+L amino acid transporter 2 n=1 Tax=Cyphellophora attinorum TaxID=1664694 RepID=A0A0N1H073_9EURO|nr:Y+L amino acid transporter 2 [Phialophora attinorum]KPI37013.1 Y+L amino acid transporter 2 [Phialophora attinorum]